MKNKLLKRQPTRTLRISSDLTLVWLQQQLGSTENEWLRLDFSDTKTVSSAALAYLRIQGGQRKRAGIPLVLVHVAEDIQALLGGSPVINLKQEIVSDATGLFLRIGTMALKAFHNTVRALSLFTEIFYWGTVGLFKKRHLKKGALGEQMYQIGFNALGIVCLLSLLIGVVLALQAAMQLKDYGGDVFLAPMIGIIMVREMGPLMTAIILAGRTGSAVTAEIATMGVQEEIDALTTMGVNPIQYIVVPKFWAITFTMPLLAVLAMASGILGGFFISLVYLQLSPALFWGELFKSISLADFSAGFMKSAVFAWIIIWIGAYYGFNAQGGAEEVGKQTTASVVAGIFMVIIADAFFSFML